MDCKDPEKTPDENMGQDCCELAEEELDNVNGGMVAVWAIGNDIIEDDVELIRKF